MDVRKRSSRGPVAAAAILLLIGVLAVPVCGSMRPKLQPRTLQLPATKIRGIGLNVHAEKLPLPEVKTLGIQWIRMELGGGRLDRNTMRSLVDYYHDFGILWILTRATAVEEARILVELGVTDIEVLNEPKLNDISAQAYARLFRSVRSAVGDRARLYGPCLSTWTAERFYLDACIREGVRPDVLTFHGYLQSSPEQFRDWISEAKSYGLPVVVSELGYPDYLGAKPYRATMKLGLGTLFLRTKKALGSTPWCWYDGPNPQGDHGTGLFDWDGRGFRRPNSGYHDILGSLRQGS